ARLRTVVQLADRQEHGEACDQKRDAANRDPEQGNAELGGHRALLRRITQRLRSPLDTTPVRSNPVTSNDMLWLHGFCLPFRVPACPARMISRWAVALFLLVKKSADRSGNPAAAA